VSITEDMMGGEWEQATRHLRVLAAPWIQPRDITYRLGSLDKVAKRVDQHESQGSLVQLDQAINELNRAVRNYAHQLHELERHIADYIASVHQARTLLAQNPKPVEEPQVHPDLGDDDMIDRLGALYGIPKPRNYRSKP